MNTPKKGRTRSRKCEDAMTAVRSGMKRYEAANTFGLCLSAVYRAWAQDVAAGIAKPIERKTK